jgi:hypothetical protein
MAITLAALLKGRVEYESLDAETKLNVTNLLGALVQLEKEVGRELHINDGYRRSGIDKPKNGAARSNHYKGLAADIDDDDSAWLWKWCRENLATVARLGFFLEDPRWTHGKVGTWMHFQIVPPASGRRIFVPSMNHASAPDLWNGVYDQKYNVVT